MNRKCVFINKSLRLAFAVILICIPGAVIAGSTEVGIEISGTVTGAGTCSVNNNQVVEIKFGDVPIQEIDGVNSHSQPVPLTVTCDGSSNDVSVWVRGNVTTWDRYSIITSTDGLGVKLWAYVPSLNMDPNPDGGVFPIHLDEISTLNIHAVLSKQPGKRLTPQEFTATATLFVEYV